MALNTASIGGSMSRTLINLTPHPVTFGYTTYPASRTPARVSVVTADTDEAINGFLIVTETYGSVTGLPDPQPNTSFIVSRMVAEAAASYRTDLLVPTGLLRDGDGRVVAATAFLRTTPTEPRVSPSVPQYVGMITEGPYDIRACLGPYTHREAAVSALIAFAKEELVNDERLCNDDDAYDAIVEHIYSEDSLRDYLFRLYNIWVGRLTYALTESTDDAPCPS